MLGYIRTDARELRVREHEYYRALYCGLCRHMGKCTGQCSRLTLSYDFVFLAVARAALTGEAFQMKKLRCLVHPFQRRYAAVDSETLRYCAHASALLTYCKLLDDCADEKGFRRLRAYALRALTHSAYRRAKRELGELNEAIRQRLSALSLYEKQKNDLPGADTPAALFGELMADVFSYGLEEKEARVAAALGEAVGHWIYLADAADDFWEDLKKGRFNPYRGLFGDKPSADDLEDLRLSMIGQLMRGEQAMLLMDNFSAPELKELLYNMMYLGMPARAERILKKMACPKGEEKQ